MPPSPGVKYYQVEGWYDGSLRYDMDFKWRDGVLDVIKLLPKSQRLHRSRQIAIGAKPLVSAELTRRSSKLNDNKKQLQDIVDSIPDKVKAELAMMVIDVTLKHMSFNWQHVVEYIADHETRGTGTGYKWGILIALGADGWRAVYEQIRAYLEDARQHIGEYLTGMFSTGLRARSNPLTESEILSGHVSGVTDRTRLVMFRAILSMEGAFLLDKSAWYREQMAQAERILGIHYDIRYPMVEGGKAYLTASEFLQSGLTQSAYDGGSWEAVVGAVLGRYIGWAATTIDGWTQEPSGWFNTTGINSIVTMLVAQLLLDRHNFGRKDKIRLIILSDDLNIYHTGKPVEYKTFGALEEFQPADTATQFMLGVTYKYDPARPRIIGVKATTDRADKAIPFHWDSLGYFNSGVVSGKADERMTATWLGLYFGVFGTRTLLDALRSEELTEFRGGSELVMDMAASNFADFTVKEVYEAIGQAANVHVANISAADADDAGMSSA